MGTIDIDYTIIIQLVNFLVAIWVVSHLLIKPIREQIQNRQDLMQGYVDDVNLFSDQAQNKLAAYEATLDSAREEALVIRTSFTDKGHEQEASILSVAQQEAQGLLRQSRDETVKEMKKALVALKKEVPGFAEKVVAKVLK